MDQVGFYLAQASASRIVPRATSTHPQPGFEAGVGSMATLYAEGAFPCALRGLLRLRCSSC